MSRVAAIALLFVACFGALATAEEPVVVYSYVLNDLDLVNGTIENSTYSVGESNDTSIEYTTTSSYDTSSTSSYDVSTTASPMSTTERIYTDPTATTPQLSSTTQDYTSTTYTTPVIPTTSGYENVSGSFDLIIQKARLTRLGVESLKKYRPNLYVAVYLNEVYQSETETKPGYFYPVFHDNRFEFKNVGIEDRITLQLIHKDGPMGPGPHAHALDAPIKVLGSADIYVSSVILGELQGKVNHLSLLDENSHEAGYIHYPARTGILTYQVTKFRENRSGRFSTEDEDYRYDV